MRTCSLTGLPIRYGDETVILCLNEFTQYKGESLLFTLQTLIWVQNKRGFIQKKDELVDHEIEYIANKSHLIGDILPIKDVIIGVYSDGLYFDNLDETPLELGIDRSNMHLFQFYHKWAVEAALDNTVENMLSDKVNLAYNLYNKLRLIGRNPMDVHLTGTGMMDWSEAMATYKRLNSAISEYIENEGKLKEDE